MHTAWLRTLLPLCFVEDATQYYKVVNRCDLEIKGIIYILSVEYFD